MAIAWIWIEDYGGLLALYSFTSSWPDKDESTKAVIDAVVDSKFQGLADSVRTEGGAP